MVVILLVIMLFQTSVSMHAMDLRTKVIGHKVEEKEYPFYQKAITAVRESDGNDLPYILATINPNAQITDVPGNPCRIHFLLTFALYEHKANAIRYLLDAGADPLMTPHLEAEGEQEHAQSILVDALNLNCAVSAELALSHVPRSLLLTHGSKATLKHLLLCLRRIKSDLPRDIRNLLCRYSVTACVQIEQLERAEHFCKNCVFKPLTNEEGTKLRLLSLQSFDVRKLARFYPAWHEQVSRLLQKQMSSI